MRMPKNPMAQQIKAWMKLYDIKYRDVALPGKSLVTVGTIINYYPVKKSRKIQEKIARALKKPFREVWPDPGPEIPNHVPSISTKKRGVNVKEKTKN